MLYQFKRVQTLKDLSLFASYNSNLKLQDKTKLFALKYFGNSLNKNFIDFYKRLKDNKGERNAKLFVALNSLKQAHKNKQFLCLAKLKPTFVEISKSETPTQNLPKLIANKTRQKLSIYFQRFINFRFQHKSKESGLKLLELMIASQKHRAHSSMQLMSQSNAHQKNIAKNVQLVKLIGTQCSKLSRCFNLLSGKKPKFSDSNHKRSWLYQIVHCHKYKLLKSLQVLKCPTFYKKEKTNALVKLHNFFEKREKPFKQQFVNTLVFQTKNKSLRFERMLNFLAQKSEKNFLQSYFVLRSQSTERPQFLFAAHKVEKHFKVAVETEVDSLVKLVFFQALEFA